MDDGRARPRSILVIGASGPIGQQLVAALTGCNYSRTGRIALLRASMGMGYAAVASGSVDLTDTEAPIAAMSEQPGAVVYLAGVGAQTAADHGLIGQELHVNALKRVIDEMDAFRNPSTLVYASSTAVHGAATAYSAQKAEGESLLLRCRAAGIALRFPTVLPRLRAQRSSLFLDEAVRRLSQGLEYRWPIVAERRVRLMSTAAAARHIVAAIALGAAGRCRRLDLPATIATPLDICNLLGGGAPSVSIQQDVDEALAARPVDIDSGEAEALGFPAAESLTQLLTSSERHLQIG